MAKFDVPFSEHDAVERRGQRVRVELQKLGEVLAKTHESLVLGWLKYEVSNRSALLHCEGHLVSDFEAKSFVSQFEISKVDAVYETDLMQVSLEFSVYIYLEEVSRVRNQIADKLNLLIRISPVAEQWSSYYTGTNLSRDGFSMQ